MTKIQFIFLTTLFVYFSCIAGELSAQVSVTATSGTLSGSYTTVKAAFDAINAGTHKGDITIKLSAGTTETASAVLNASGSGSSSYNSVNLYPTVTGVVISGDIAGPLIELNGAVFVTIDGSVGATGLSVDMKIENTSTSPNGGTSTVCFMHDAMGNFLQDCYVLGSSMATIGGIIYFGSGSNSGNNNNIVSNCNITNSGGNRSLNALYSNSSTGVVNLANSVLSNKFYDFFNTGADSYGINLVTGSSNWSIYYNSFYETTSFAPLSNHTYYCINVNNTSGTQFNISNNYIGGSAVSCGGIAFTKTSAANNVFYGIRISAGTSVVSYVNGNIIKNISWTNSGNAPFYGIAGSDGYLNIGTPGGGNIIGASSGNGSITYSAGADLGQCFGICCMTAGNVSVDGNTIGAVTATNSATLVTNFYGIYSGGSNTFTGNTISGNTLLNLVNNSAGTGSIINGIFISAGKNTVTGNTVHDLSMPWSENNASNYQLSAAGIVVNNNTAVVQTITGNTIYNISNTYYPFSGSLAGIYYSGSATLSSVSGNFIYDITATGGGSSGSVYGVKADAGTTTFANNIINLSSNVRSVLYGIYEPGTSENNSSVYFNTVLFGIVTGDKNSYCLYSAGSTNTRNFRNNIFNNYRSNSGAKAYCVYYNATTSTNLTTDYNDYDGSLIGYYNGADRTTLTDLKNAIGQDAGSLNLNPDYTGPMTTPEGYYPLTALAGVSGTGITTDFSGATRAATPTMGAIEGQIVVTWTGVTSTDWSTTTNWTQNRVPESVQNVSIPSGTPHSPHVTTDPASNSSCNKITIASGAALTIDAGKALHVFGTLTNNAGVTGLVLNSDASGTGMLFQTSAGVSATVQRYYPAPASWSDGTHGWHFLSAPVTAQSVAPEFWEQAATAYDFYAWWEPTNEWVNYKNDHTPPTWFTANVLGGTSATGYFIPGKGYLAAFETTKTRSFTGTLNASDIPVSGLTNTGTATYKGWNLLGNPFPCPIAWNNAGGGWALSNIDAACQIWNEAIASYTVIGAGSLIPSTNGFMVHVTNTGSGSLTIPSSAMRLSSSPWYKSGETEDNRIVLKAVDPAGQTAQETIIAFDPAATEDFDPFYDSYFLAGYAPMFYSVNRNKDYALNCLPELNSSLLIPLSFHKNNSSDFGIELIRNIPGTNVYLTDFKLNKTQNLTSDPVYTFSSSVEDAPERFQLSFVLNGTGEEKKPASGIYAWENSVYVRNQGTSELQIYNLTGQTVFSEEITQQGLCRVVLNVPRGYYIARLTGDAGVTVKKIYINN